MLASYSSHVGSRICRSGISKTARHTCRSIYARPAIGKTAILDYPRWLTTTNSSQSNATPETQDAPAAKAELRIPLHDPVPTLFADGIHSANVIAGCVRLDLFAEHAWAGAKGTQPMVVGRIVVPLERFAQFARGADVLLKRLREAGPAQAREKADGT